MNEQTTGTGYRVKCTGSSVTDKVTNRVAPRVTNMKLKSKLEVMKMPS